MVRKGLSEGKSFVMKKTVDIFNRSLIFGFRAQVCLHRWYYILRHKQRLLSVTRFSKIIHKSRYCQMY